MRTVKAIPALLAVFLLLHSYLAAGATWSPDKNKDVLPSGKSEISLPDLIYNDQDLTKRWLAAPDGFFQVNTYATDNQHDASIAVLSNAGFVIAWVSQNQDGSNGGIYGQRYSSSGATTGSEFLINTNTAGIQSYPVIAPLSSGGFVVVWQSYNQDGSEYGIYAQVYSSSGNAEGSEFQVNTQTTNSQQRPKVASLGSGFVVIWSSYDQDGSQYGVFAQRFSSAGTKEGSEFQVNTYTSNNQDMGGVASLSGGGFVMTWSSFGQDGSGSGVYAQLFDATGVKVGSEFSVNTYVDNGQQNARVAALTNGGFVATWQSGGQDGHGWGIYAQRFSSTGAKEGAEFLVNTVTSSDQQYPDVSSLSTGGFVIVWYSSSKIYGQRFSSTGDAVGSEFLVSIGIDNGYNPSVAALSGGEFLVAWNSYVPDEAFGDDYYYATGQYDIFAQRFDANANPSSGSGSTTSSPTASVTAAPTAAATSLSTSVPTALPTTDATPVTETPTSPPTSFPSSLPTSVPTSASNIPTSAPSSSPSSLPTRQPTEAVAEHIVAHLYDIHGDGWLDNLYFQVAHDNGAELHSLHCACKVVRVFTPDATLSLWRNRTVRGPKGDVMPYEWEALWSVGYSDGVTETSFGVFGGVNSVIEVRGYALSSTRDVLDFNADKPSNMCVPPSPKAKPYPFAAADVSDENHDNSSDTSPKPPPSPLVDVRLALMTSNGESWCDDSGGTSTLPCDKEHQFSNDASLPNLLVYPRYYISRTNDNRVVASGTLRTDETEWVTSVQLQREGSYVFSVSGTYTSSLTDGLVSWDFCGEQGGINERLHFDMVKSVCRAHYIEEVSGGLTCYESLGGSSLLTNMIEPLSLSSGLQHFRNYLIPFGVAVVGLMTVLALMVTKFSKRGKVFSRLDTTEHV